MFKAGIQIFRNLFLLRNWGPAYKQKKRTLTFSWSKNSAKKTLSQLSIFPASMVPGAISLMNFQMYEDYRDTIYNS